MGLRVTQQGCLFLAGVITARTLGPAGRAQYALPLALAVVVWAISHLSVSEAAARLLAQRAASMGALAGWLASAAAGISVVGFSVCLGVGVLTSDVMLADASFATILLAAATIPALVVGQMCETLLLSGGSLRAVGVIGLASGATYLVVISVLALFGSVTPVTVLATTAAVLAFSALTAGVRLGQIVGARALRPTWPRLIARPGLASAARLHPATVARQLAMRVDLILISLVVTVHETGLYSLAATLAFSLSQAAFIVTQTALPHQTLGLRDEAVAYTAVFTRRLFRLAPVVGASAGVLAYPFIVMVYGDDWRGAVIPLVILVAGVLASTVELPMHALIVRTGRVGRLSVLALVTVAVNAAAILILGWRFGLIGAAAGSAVVQWGYALSVLALAARDTGVDVRSALGFQRPKALPAEIS